MLKKFFALNVMLILLLTSGCTRQISQNVYKGADVGAPAKTYRGVIVSVRQVTVEEGDMLENNALGIAGGGLLGGVVGSQFGGGNTAPLIGAGIGAIAGGIGGAFLEKHLKTQEAIEYTIQIDGSSNLMTIVQGMDEMYRPGQRVLVMVYSQGRSRIVADQSQAVPGQYAVAPAQVQPTVQAAYAPIPAQQPQVVYVQVPPASVQTQQPQVVYMQPPSK